MTYKSNIMNGIIHRYQEDRDIVNVTICTNINPEIDLTHFKYVCNCCQYLPKLLFPKEETGPPPTVPYIKYHVLKYIFICSVHDILP